MTQVRFEIGRYRRLADEVCAKYAHLPPSIRGTMAITATVGRKCDVTKIERNDETEWLYNSLETVAANANREYGFSTSGIEEPLQLVTYGVGDSIDWHIDTGQALAARRKLSISLQLSEPDEYTGGDLDFPDGMFHPFARARGTAICFPSYLFHRVSPITAGARRALVAWYSGKPFI
jgi:PKHD-type hydroxylase